MERAPQFLASKSQNMHAWKLKKNHLPHETMISLQLGETFSGFKIQRFQSSRSSGPKILCFSNTMGYLNLCAPPPLPISKGLLRRPWLLNGYVPLNKVWYLRSWVLKRVYNFTIKRLKKGHVSFEPVDFKRVSRLEMGGLFLWHRQLFFPMILVGKLLKSVG